MDGRLKRLTRRCEAWGRRVLYAAAAGLIRPRGQGQPFDLHRVGRILLVKEPFRMGDALQATPAIKALRQECPEAHIAIVVRKRNEAVFAENPDLDEVILFDKAMYNRRPWKAVSFIRQIRRKRFDLAVTLETMKVHLTNDWIAYLSGAPYRARYDGAAFGAPWSNAFYNILAPFDPGRRHEVEKNFGVLKHLGVPDGDKRLVLQVSEKSDREAGRILDSLGLGRDRRLIGVHPGSKRIDEVRWPLRRFTELVRRMKDEGLGTVVIVLGPEEEDLAREFPADPVITGLPLGVLGAVLRRFSLFVCNHTGVMHVAGAVGVRSLVICGDIMPEIWVPYGGHVTILQARDKRLESVGVEDALRSITHALQTIQ